MPYAGKAPYQYPAWVNSGKVPEWIEQELKLARLRAATHAEEHAAAKRKHRGGKTRPSRASRTISRAFTPLDASETR